MTLVASFKLREVPVLVGDFLLTDGQVGVKHNALSTRPDLKDVKSTLQRRRVAGLRKKIQKIGERLVVGFTGDLIPGQAIMKALFDEFSNKHPTKNELEEFLSKIAIKNKNKIWLVGWIWEKRPLCFQWYGTHPNKVQMVDSAILGSGRKHFINEIMKVDISGFGPDLTTALEQATHIAIAKAGRILYTELTTASNLDNAYGFSAEIILWDGAKFFYVDSIAYNFFDLEVNANNTKTLTPGYITAIYKNFDTYSALQVAKIGPKQDGTGLEAIQTDLHYITPLSEDKSNINLENANQLPNKAKYWFTGIRVKNPKKRISAIFSCVSDGSEGSLIHNKDGRMNINIKELEAMIPKELTNG